MKIAHAALSIAEIYHPFWVADWLWGVTLIVLIVIFHVFGLLFIKDKVENVQRRVAGHSRPSVVFVVVIGIAALMATVLHGIEAAIWAKAFLILGAVSDDRSAILYSLNAITSYGHANVYLGNSWQLMGALEALNGVMLFGLTTAFLFGIMVRVSELQRKR